MNTFDRIYALHQIFKARRYPVTKAQLQADLECSRATISRHIHDLRDYYQAPLESIRGKGYVYTDGSYELPGLWFNAQELEALIALQALLTNLESGFLKDRLEPLQHYMHRLLQKTQHTDPENWSRLRILGMHQRSRRSPFFPLIARSVLERRQLQISYYSRSDDRHTQRRLSPQRLIHYRDNWYLDAWCHERNGLRSFSLDGIQAASLLDAHCDNLGTEALDDYYASAYGIFSGPASNTACLRFTGYIARWVAHESWHPDQTVRWLEDGRYELKLPYHRDTELIMDICRYGPEVEVVAPLALRDKVAAYLNDAARQYRDAN